MKYIDIILSNVWILAMLLGFTKLGSFTEHQVRSHNNPKKDCNEKLSHVILSLYKKSPRKTKKVC